MAQEENNKPWENVGDTPREEWRPRKRYDEEQESSDSDFPRRQSRQEGRGNFRGDNRRLSRDGRDYRKGSGTDHGGRDDRRGYNRDNRSGRDDRRGYNRDNRSGRDDRRGYNRDNRSGRDDRRSYNTRDWKERDRQGHSYGREGQEGRFGAPRGDRGDYGRSRMGTSKRGQGTAGRTRYLEIPASVEASMLDRESWRQLSPLPKETAETVAKHLVMAGDLVDSNPELAYAHAQAALKMAWRIDIVREAVALTAYACGKYSEALREVRTVRRMSGSESLRAIEADSERGLGNLTKALEIIADADLKNLDAPARAELAIVESAVRSDLGEPEAGLVVIEKIISKYDPEDTFEYNRLLSVKADRLRELGRADEASEVEQLIIAEPEEVSIVDLQAEAEAEERANPTSMQGTNVALLEEYPLVMLDLDGVTWHGDTAIEQAVAGIAAVRNSNGQVLFLTNNASRPPEEVVQKLAKMDVPATSADVVTSAQDGAVTLQGIVAPGAKILCIGGPGVSAAAEEAGFTPVTTTEENPEAVLQGLGFDVGWQQLSEACYAIESGAKWVATNLDYALPTEKGRGVGNGSFVETVKSVTKAEPIACGKPQPSIYNLALRRAQEIAKEIPWVKDGFTQIESELEEQMLEWKPSADISTGEEPSEAEIAAQRDSAVQGRRNKRQLRFLREKSVAVGDQLATDIMGAKEAKIKSCVVLSGLTTPKALILAGFKQRPDFVALDLSDLNHPFPRPQLSQRGWWYVDGALGRVSRGVLELRGVGKLTEDGTVISLAEFRALLAAAWHAREQGERVECPEFIVRREVERTYDEDDRALLADIAEEYSSDETDSWGEVSPQGKQEVSVESIDEVSAEEN